MLECKCFFTFDSSKDGGRFLIHIRVVVEADGVGSDVIVANVESEPVGASSGAV